jgi:hypothetical protein
MMKRRAIPCRPFEWDSHPQVPDTVSMREPGRIEPRNRAPRCALWRRSGGAATEFPDHAVAGAGRSTLTVGMTLRVAPASRFVRGRQLLQPATSETRRSRPPLVPAESHIYDFRDARTPLHENLWDQPQPPRDLLPHSPSAPHTGELQPCLAHRARFFCSRVLQGADQRV